MFELVRFNIKISYFLFFLILLLPQGLYAQNCGPGLKYYGGGYCGPAIECDGAVSFERLPDGSIGPPSCSPYLYISCPGGKTNTNGDTRISLGITGIDASRGGSDYVQSITDGRINICQETCPDGRVVRGYQECYSDRPIVNISPVSVLSDEVFTIRISVKAESAFNYYFDGFGMDLVFSPKGASEKDALKYGWNVFVRKGDFVKEGSVFVAKKNVKAKNPTGIATTYSSVLNYRGGRLKSNDLFVDVNIEFVSEGQSLPMVVAYGVPKEHLFSGGICGNFSSCVVAIDAIDVERYKSDDRDIKDGVKRFVLRPYSIEKDDPNPQFSAILDDLYLNQDGTRKRSLNLLMLSSVTDDPDKPLAKLSVTLPAPNIGRNSLSLSEPLKQLAGIFSGVFGWLDFSFLKIFNNE